MIHENENRYGSEEIKPENADMIARLKLYMRRKKNIQKLVQ